MPLSGNLIDRPSSEPDRRRGQRDEEPGSASSVILNSGTSPSGAINLIGFNQGTAIGGAIMLLDTAAIACTSGAETNITFNSLLQKGTSFNLSTATQKVLISYAGAGLGLSGSVTFASNSTGYRKVSALFYSPADALLLTEVLATVPAVNGEATVVPINGRVYLPLQAAGAAYVVFSALQNSGGSLNVTRALISVDVVA